MIHDDTDPQHHKYKATFRLHSWWESNENPARVFVIVSRHHSNLGDIEAIELLEKGKEWAVKREYAEIFKLFKLGVLLPVSNMPSP